MPLKVALMTNKYNRFDLFEKRASRPLKAPLAPPRK